MGVKNLLRYLQSISISVHVSRYAGKKAGIDIYGWLYRGAYGCCVELATGNETYGYIDYCIEKLELLIKHDIEPIVVFDGAPPASKMSLITERREQRQANLEKGFEHLENGNDEASRLYFSRATRVTPEMKSHLIKALQVKGIKFIVAPYEADPQLAYLSRNGMVDVVISDDSDCLPYGCKCVLFKLDQDGNGEEIKRKNLGANEQLCFSNWTNDMFVTMCILSGCDYCPSIQNLGIVAAYKLVQQHKSFDRVLDEVLSDSKRHGSIPLDYGESFYKALLTFRHHKVYDPQKDIVCHLVPLEQSQDIMSLVQDVDFLGSSDRDKLLKGIAKGEIDAITGQKYDYATVKNASNQETTAETTKESNVLNISFPEKVYGRTNRQKGFDWEIVNQSSIEISPHSQSLTEHPDSASSEATNKKFPKENFNQIHSAEASSSFSSAFVQNVCRMNHSRKVPREEKSEMQLQRNMESKVKSRYNSPLVGEDFHAIISSTSHKINEKVDIKKFKEMSTRKDIDTKVRKRKNIVHLASLRENNKRKSTEVSEIVKISLESHMNHATPDNREYSLKEKKLMFPEIEESLSGSSLVWKRSKHDPKHFFKLFEQYSSQESHPNELAPSEDSSSNFDGTPKSATVSQKWDEILGIDNDDHESDEVAFVPLHYR